MLNKWVCSDSFTKIPTSVSLRCCHLTLSHKEDVRLQLHICMYRCIDDIDIDFRWVSFPNIFFLFFQKVCISNKIQFIKSLSIASRLLFNFQNFCIQNTMSISKFGRKYLLWTLYKVHYIWSICYFIGLVYFVCYFKRKLGCVQFAL